MKKFFISIVSLILLNTTTHAQWHPSTGLYYEYAGCLEESGNQIFFGASPEIYVSSDKGENWELLGNSPFPHDYFQSILIDGNHIYAGSKELLMISSDLGQTWTTNADYKLVTSLILAGDTLVMSANNKVYFSTDQGNSFVYGGLQSSYSEFLDLAYLNGVFYAGSRAGLYRSYDRGISWSQFNNIPTLVVTFWDDVIDHPDILSLKTHQGSLYAGGIKRLFVTHDNGQTWEIIADLAYSPTTGILVNDDEIYLSFLISAYRSTDHGSNWTLIPDVSFNTITKQGDYVFAGGDHNLYKSGPQPEPDFKKVGEGIGKPTIIEFFMENGKLYCLAKGETPGNFSNIEEKFMIASTIDGIEWTNETKLGTIHPGSFSHSKSDTIYYGFLGNKVLKRALNSNYYRHYNSPQNVSCFEFSGDTVFCGSSQGVHFSTDYCQSWTRCNTGIWSYDITDLLMVDDTLYAATRDQGVFRSTDLGASWSEARQGIISMNVNKLKVLQGKIYAFTDIGFSYSANGGVSWNSLNSGIESIKVNDIFAHNGVFLIATDNGLYISHTNGSGWKLYNEGLEGIGTLCLNATEDKILVGTKDHAVWFQSLSSLGMNDYSFENEGIMIFPNPAEDMLIIINNNYPTMRTFELQLINTLGQKIMKSTVSTREFNIDLKKLKSKGIHFLHLSTPAFNYNETRKIIVH